MRDENLGLPGFCSSVLPCLGLGSCGGGWEQVAVSPEASAETPRATPNAAESSAAREASGPNDPLTSELAKGKEIPATWHSELPLLENGTLIVVNDTSNLISLNWSVKSQEPYAKLVEQYWQLPGR
jgi:lipoprotein